MHAALVQRKNIDRRKDRRVAMHGAIDLRASGIDLDLHAMLEDISSGGCKISARVPLQMKHPVRLELPRPGASPLRITGNVVRAYGTTSDRLYHYGIRFRIESIEARTEIRHYVSLYTRRVASIGSMRSERRDGTGGVDVKLPADIFVADVGRMTATVIALKGDGMRVAGERVLRQEWTMKIDLRLPNDATGQSALVTVTARAVPGVREARGQFVQDLVFVEPALRVRTEIERFMYETRLKETR